MTTPESLPPHHQQRQEVLQIMSAAEAHGQLRLVEMNQQVLGNLTGSSPPCSKTTLARRARLQPTRADNTRHIVADAQHRHEYTRAKAVRALRELETAGTW